jgi:hypothetical protein
MLFSSDDVWRALPIFVLRIEICHVVSYSKKDYVKYFKFFRS